MNSIYNHSFISPEGAPVGLSNSVGETMTAARDIGGHSGAEIASAARVAFVDAHGTVLMAVAVMIGLLSAAIHFALRNTPRSASH